MSSNYENKNIENFNYATYGYPNGYQPIYLKYSPIDDEYCYDKYHDKNINNPIVLLDPQGEFLIFHHRIQENYNLNPRENMPYRSS